MRGEWNGSRVGASEGKERETRRRLELSSGLWLRKNPEECASRTAACVRYEATDIIEA